VIKEAMVKDDGIPPLFTPFHDMKPEPPAVYKMILHFMIKPFLLYDLKHDSLD